MQKLDEMGEGRGFARSAESYRLEAVGACQSGTVRTCVRRLLSLCLNWTVEVTARDRLLSPCQLSNTRLSCAVSVGGSVEYFPVSDWRV